MEKERYYTHLANTIDEGLAKRALDLALSEGIIPTTRPQIIATVSEEYPELAFDFVDSHREQVLNLVEPTARERYVPGLVSSGNDTDLVAKLRAYADKYIPAQARRAVDVAAGQINLNANVRTKRLPELDRWINDNGY
jgi:aminopeptidase N